MFINLEIMLKTCNFNFVLCDMPLWKHIMLIYAISTQQQSWKQTSGQGASVQAVKAENQQKDYLNKGELSWIYKSIYQTQFLKRNG